MENSKEVSQNQNQRFFDRLEIEFSESFEILSANISDIEQGISEIQKKLDRLITFDEVPEKSTSDTSGTAISNEPKEQDVRSMLESKLETLRRMSNRVRDNGKKLGELYSHLDKLV